jgi:C4-dicarboxylate-specific signal transduction histidine kinase
MVSVTARSLDRGPEKAPPGAELPEALIRLAAVGAVSGQILHELAGLLQAFQSGVYELAHLADNDSPEDRAEVVAVMASSADRMSKIFTALRAYTRPESPRTGCTAEAAVAGAVPLIQATVRSAVDLRVGAVAPVQLALGAAQLQHLMLTMVRALLSATAGTTTRVDLALSVEGEAARLTARAAVPYDPALAEALATPPAAARSELTLSAAVAAASVQAAGGSFGYEPDADGARMVADIPLRRGA